MSTELIETASPAKTPTRRVHYLPQAGRDAVACGAGMKHYDDELIKLETSTEPGEVTCKACAKWILRWRT